MILEYLDKVLKRRVGFKHTDGTLNVTDISLVPPIIPTINTVATGEIFIDVLTDAQVVGVKVTANPGDPVTAASNLANGQPDVVFIGLDETQEIRSSTAITNVTIAAVANIAVGEIAYNATTKIATGTIATSLVAADFETVQVEFDFKSTDNVNLVIIGLAPFSDGTTDKNQAVLTITGRSV